MEQPESGSRLVRFAILKPDSQPRTSTQRPVVLEAPIAIEYNGIGYAVMMATPTDLQDYALGFSLSEQLINDAAELLAVDIHQASPGWIVRVQLSPDRIGKVIDRARQRVSEGSCGLCGMDNLDEVMRPLPPVTARVDVTPDAIFVALGHLRTHQPLNRSTGAAHAAAFCNPDGTIVMAREDVGRHNALDKLLGGLAQANITPSGGFLLLTARCSFELTQKAIIANCPLLVTISAATDLAITLAAKHGLQLISLARPDGALAASLQSD